MSDTTNDRMLYVAQVCSDNEHILRVSVPYNGKVYLALWMLPAVVLSSIFAFIVSVLFSRHFTNTVSKPLQQVTDEIRKYKMGIILLLLKFMNMMKLQKLHQLPITLHRK